jgi:hypothetical protein
MGRTAYIIEKDGEHKEYFFYPEPLDKAGFKGLAEYAEGKHGEDVCVYRATDAELAAIEDGIMDMFAAEDSE